jgi:hypothetical protein
VLSSLDRLFTYSCKMFEGWPTIVQFYLFSHLPIAFKFNAEPINRCSGKVPSSSIGYRRCVELSTMVCYAGAHFIGYCTFPFMKHVCVLVCSYIVIMHLSWLDIKMVCFAAL